MQKILFPSFADQKHEICEDDDAENSDKKKVIPEKIYVSGSLHARLLIRTSRGKVADKI